MSAPELSVVVPVHNEAENIAPLVDEIRRALLDTERFEIVVVDDQSTDGTAERLESCAQATPELRIVRLERNVGQSTAIHVGVRHARASLIATLDGDGQNDPADIPALVDRYRATPHNEELLITGHRTLRRDTLTARAASRMANAVRALILKDRTPDTGCGLKVFGRDLFLALPYFDHMHRFLPALVLRAGGRVLSVPVHHRARATGRSHYGIANRLGTGIVDLVGVAWLIRRARTPTAVEHTASAHAIASRDDAPRAMRR